jgi:hypothetical protein
MAKLHLVPAPKALSFTGGAYVLPAEVFLVLEAHPAARRLFAAERFILDAEPLSGSAFRIALGQGVDAGREIRVRHEDSVAGDVAAPLREQAYRLTIAPEGIEIAAGGAAGAFYGFQTLLQVIREAAFSRSRRPDSKEGRRGGKKRRSAWRGLSLPCLTITDVPDFARRGVYHDTARGKVPTVDTLLQLIDDLGHLKYNEFQLYIENGFEFRKHPDMYDDTDPFTAEELLILDAACRARHIDFVPSLSSLGHFEKILARPAYRPLAEAEPAQLKAINATCWHEASPWSLCVTDPGARALLREMYDEFVPNFSSRQFNICCDEAYDLGLIRSKQEAERVGTGQLYVDWIRYCEGLARGHGKSIQMWGDIILKYPELIPQLPEDAVLLEWGYEHDHKFDEHCRVFAERIGKSASGKRAGRSFYVAPGTSSWLTLSSRTKNAFGNIHAAARAGLAHGAAGVLVTDWGDYGHQQFLGVSLLPFAYGAAASWNLEATDNPCRPGAPVHMRNSELLKAISFHLFEDPTGRFAAAVYDLGLMYEKFGWQRFNASVDWWLFREKWDFANYVNRVKAGDLQKVIAAAEGLAREFQAATLLHPQNEVLVAELVLTCEVIIHTAKRTLLRQQWLAAYPARRNPEEETLRGKPARAVPSDFRRRMEKLRVEVRELERRYGRLWLARNKRSRLADVIAEFRRLGAEYRRFSR